MIGTISTTLLYHKSPTHGVPSCYIKFQRFTWLSDHKKKKKKFDGRKRTEKFLTFPSCIFYWEKVNESYAIFGLWKKWTQKGAPAKVCILSFNLHLILLCCNDVCLKFTKLLILLKKNHLKILILTSFCRDPTDINPLLILIQDLCIFFQVISMT